MLSSKRNVIMFALGICLMLVSAAAMAQTPADAVADVVANSGVFPAGTTVVSVTSDDTSLVVDLSGEAIPFPFTDTLSDGYSTAIAAAVSGWPDINSIEITVGGVQVSKYLPANTSPDYTPAGGSIGNPLDAASLSWSPMSAQNPILSPSVAPLTNELAGKLIVLGPSHGSYASATGWFRAMRTLCGPNPVTNRPPGIGNYQPSDYYYWTKGFTWPMYYEDDMSPELIRFVYAYCMAAGGDTYVNRNLDKTAGVFPATSYGYPATSYPKWQVAAKYHLQDIGLPQSVWDEPAFPAQTDKDIRARAYYANYLMQTKGYNKDNSVYLALHSNAANTGTNPPGFQAQARGTETLQSLAFSTWKTEQARSPEYATAVNNGIINSIRNEYDGFWANDIYNATITPLPPEWFTSYGTYRGYNHAGASTGLGTNGWQNRGMKSGNYGEVRECKMPAALTELVFHDDWKFYPDEAFHQDKIFRATVAWGIYEGISNFFGVALKPRLAASVDSVTFPQFVLPAATVNVAISMKNLGQAWCWGNKMIGTVYSSYNVWNLQATAADQFGAAGTKIALANDGVYYPGDTAAFAVTLTAPAVSGTYTTAWQMLKDDARGGAFGDIASASIGVDGIAPEITITAPQDSLYGPSVAVEFSATDVMSGVASLTADVDGAAVTSGSSVTLATGSHTLTVTAVDALGNISTKAVAFNVDADPPTVTISSPAAQNYAYGCVTVAFGASDALSQVASTTANIDGVAVTNGQTVCGLGLGVHVLTVTAVDTFGNTASQTVTFSVVNSAGKVTIGGWIELADKKGTCGFNCEYVAGEAAPTGHLTYQDHDTGMTVQSIDMVAMGITGNRAWFYGTCEVEGEAGHWFRVDVTDNGEPGRNDVFNIMLDTGYSKGGTLGGGNVQVD